MSVKSEIAVEDVIVLFSNSLYPFVDHGMARLFVRFIKVIVSMSSILSLPLFKSSMMSVWFGNKPAHHIIMMIHNMKMAK